MSSRRIGVLAASLLVSLGLCGCGESGPTKYSVSGVVKFKGEPVSEGIVQFFNPTVGSAGVELEEDGTFNFAPVGGLIAEDYMVFVEPPPEQVTPPEKDRKPTMPREYPNIPMKYRQAATSGLKATISGKTTDLEFDMQP